MQGRGGTTGDISVFDWRVTHVRRLALVVEGGRDGPQPRFPASGRGDDERSWVQQACESCCLYLEK